MNLILISERSKSVCEFGGTNEIHESNKIKADRYDRILQLSQREERRSWHEVGPTNCPDLGNKFKTINVRNKSQ